MLVSLKLNIPRGVFEKYEAQASASETSTESVVADRLVTCVNQTSKKPLYIDDEMRQKFDSLFGKNLSTPEQLYKEVEKLLKVNVADIEVNLKPLVVTRLRTRCFGTTFEDFVKQRVTEGLEEYVGMR